MTLLDKIVRGLRQALMDKDPGVFKAALAATRITSNVTKEALNPHLKAMLMQISKRALQSKFKDDVTLTLQVAPVHVLLCWLPVCRRGACGNMFC